MKRKIQFALLNLIGAQSSNDGWMNFREQDLHRNVFRLNFRLTQGIYRTFCKECWIPPQSYLFGGYGYGPDTAVSNGTDSSNSSEILVTSTPQTFEVNYNPDVAPRDKSKLKKFADSDFQDLDAFVSSECGKYSEELQSKKKPSFHHKLSFTTSDPDDRGLVQAKVSIQFPTLRLSLYQLCEFRLHVGLGSRRRQSRWRRFWSSVEFLCR